MKRYRGEDLPPNPRIAVIANDALGNFVAATPLLQMLRFKWEPKQLWYFGGTRTAELEQASDLFDFFLDLQGIPLRETVRKTSLLHDHFDLVVNLDQLPIARAFAAILSGSETYVVGPCLGADGRGDLPFAEDRVGDLARDANWIGEDTVTRYPFLDSGFIGEIFCRLCYLEGPIPTYRVPSADPESEVPEVLIATAASLPEKLWPVEKWLEVVADLRKEARTIGLLGAKPSEQGKHWLGADEESRLVDAGVHDLRGKLRLPQVVGALERAQAVLTIDNGILHLAAAAGTKTVGLFRHGIHRLWAPPFANLTVLTAGEGRNVAEIEVDAVLEAIRRAL